MKDKMRERGVSLSLLCEYLACWWSVCQHVLWCYRAEARVRQFQKTFRGLGMAELYMDWEAWRIKTAAWLAGLQQRGFAGAHLAAAGLE